jgi:hypothetical protein
MAVVRLNGNISWYNEKLADIAHFPSRFLEKPANELFPGVFIMRRSLRARPKPVVGKVGRGPFPVL